MHLSVHSDFHLFIALLQSNPKSQLHIIFWIY